LAVDFKRSTLLLNIIDPTISALWNKRVTSLDYLKSLKPQKRRVHYLIIKVRAFLFCEKEKKALSIGREAIPKISSLLTGSHDIQIDNIWQVAKLDRDIKKANEDKN
jgi:hypothetical protein